MPDTLLPDALAPVIARLGVALLIGFLIGLERGWRHRQEAEGERLAGLRTYTLYGFAGGAAASFPADLAAFAIAAAGLGVTALVVAGYVGALREPEPDRGLTSEAAAIATVLLGALAGTGELAVAGAGAVMVVLVLSLKQQLHAFIALIRHDEMRTAIKLLVISLLVLPFLPNRGFGPDGILNPYEIWWAVVLVAGLSFAGYIAIRALGARNGPLVFGLVGGLASSTAVTVTAARLARTDAALAGPFAGAIAAASATMMCRVAILVAIFSPPLFALAWPALAVGAVASLVAGFAMRGAVALQDDRQAALPPPDDLWFALAFGALLVAISLGIHFAERYFGDAGLLALGAISGTFDVDAFTLSAARSVGHSASAEAACAGLLTAVAVNTVMKGLLALTIGGEALAKRVAVIVGAALIAGMAAWLLS